MEKTVFIHMRTYPKLKKDAESEAKKRSMRLTTWVEQAMIEKIERDKAERERKAGK